MNKLHHNYIKQLYIKHGAPIYNFNIFGIRNEDRQEQDIWNDWIGFFTPNSICYFFRGTTDPGIYWSSNPSNPKGVAHLCLGHHENIWRIDKHRGQYTALCNRWPCKPTKIWRDTNKNLKQDITDIVEKGYFGMNLHRANALYIIEKIGRYSAGCQVVLNPKHYDILINAAIASPLIRFDYFLFDKSQIPFYEEIKEWRN